eukprot:1161260-Pelagomonas_calceolata.AAC.2
MACGQKQHSVWSGGKVPVGLGWHTAPFLTFITCLFCGPGNSNACGWSCAGAWAYAIMSHIPQRNITSYNERWCKGLHKVWPVSL